MIHLIIPAFFVKGLADSFIDNLIRETVVEPAIGSVVYCDLFMGAMEHSGIYVGNGQIIHYNKHGAVERVSREKFVEGTTALSIYVGCVGFHPIGSPDIAKNAENLQRSQREENYNVVLNNCHQFSEMCVTGKPSTATFLRFLKWTCESQMGVDNWRVWERNSCSKQRTLDLTPTDANLEALDIAIKEQEAMVVQTDRLVREKTSEFSKHSSNQPSTVFFFEGRMESWQRKFDTLSSELNSRERVADQEYTKLDKLNKARSAMKKQLDGQENITDIMAKVTAVRAMLDSLI